VAGIAAAATETFMVSGSYISALSGRPGSAIGGMASIAATGSLNVRRTSRNVESEFIEIHATIGELRLFASAALE
jgi:hypothetical protein